MSQTQGAVQGPSSAEHSSVEGFYLECFPFSHKERRKVKNVNEMPFPKRRWSSLRKTSKGGEKDQQEFWRLIPCPWHSRHRKAAKTFLCHTVFSGGLSTSLSWCMKGCTQNKQCLWDQMSPQHSACMMDFHSQCIFLWKHSFHAISDIPNCCLSDPFSRSTPAWLVHDIFPTTALNLLCYMQQQIKNTTSCFSPSLFC